MSTELRQALEQVARRFRQVRLWSGLALCWLALVPARPGRPRRLAAGRRRGRCRAPGCVAVRARGRGLGDRMRAAGAALGARPALGGPADRGEASRAGHRAPGRRRRGRRRVLGPARVPADRRHPRGPGPPPGARLGRDGPDLDAPRRAGWSTRWHSPCLIAVVVHAGHVSSVRRPAARDRSHSAGEHVRRHRSTRATPRSSAAPRSWSSPASTALCRPTRASSSTDQEHTAARRTMTRSLRRPDVRRPRRVGRDRPRLSRRVRRPEHARRITSSVFEYPELERTDAQLVFPEYTSLEPKTVEDIRHVTAVEGTELTLLCRLNKDVATARLVDEKGSRRRARARRRGQPRLPRRPSAHRPAAVPGQAGRPRGAAQQAGRRDRGERHAEPPARWSR